MVDRREEIRALRLDRDEAEKLIDYMMADRFKAAATIFDSLKNKSVEDLEKLKEDPKFAGINELNYIIEYAKEGHTQEEINEHIDGQKDIVIKRHQTLSDAYKSDVFKFMFRGDERPEKIYTVGEVEDALEKSFANKPEFGGVGPLADKRILEFVLKEAENLDPEMKAKRQEDLKIVTVSRGRSSEGRDTGTPGSGITWDGLLNDTENTLGKVKDWAVENAKEHPIIAGLVAGAGLMMAGGVFGKTPVIGGLLSAGMKIVGSLILLVAGGLAVMSMFSETRELKQKAGEVTARRRGKGIEEPEVVQQISLEKEDLDQNINLAFKKLDKTLMQNRAVEIANAGVETPETKRTAEVVAGAKANLSRLHAALEAGELSDKDKAQLAAFTNVIIEAKDPVAAIEELQGKNVGTDAPKSREKRGAMSGAGEDRIRTAAAAFERGEGDASALEGGNNGKIDPGKTKDRDTVQVS